MRLGKDVFLNNRINDDNKKRFTELMQAFSILIKLYEVDDYMACATSALREAHNGNDLVSAVKKEIGLKIHIIDGNKEADLINKSLRNFIDQKNYLHIDVGGGSTEINIFKKGEKIAARSFKLGSVRTLEKGYSQSILSQMNKFIALHLSMEKNVLGIGTGGNINKILELSRIKGSKANLKVTKIQETLDMLETCSYQDRINLLNLNEDRADVIVPATKIYLAALEAARVKEIIVPDAGLKDGILLYLFEKNLKNGKYQFSPNNSNLKT